MAAGVAELVAANAELAESVAALAADDRMAAEPTTPAVPPVPPMAPPPSAPPVPAEPEWLTLTREIQVAHMGLLRLQFPAVDDAQLAPVAEATVSSAVGGLVGLPEEERMTRGRALLADTRKACSEARQARVGRTEERASDASRDRSADSAASAAAASTAAGRSDDLRRDARE